MICMLLSSERKTRKMIQLLSNVYAFLVFRMLELLKDFYYTRVLLAFSQRIWFVRLPSKVQTGGLCGSRPIAALDDSARQDFSTQWLSPKPPRSLKSGLMHLLQYHHSAIGLLASQQCTSVVQRKAVRRAAHFDLSA